MFAVLLFFALVTYAHGHHHCGHNEHYLVCGPTIEPTCRTWRPHTRSTCKTGGCFCVSGKVRDERTKCCVDIGQCKCKVNEFRNALGNCVLGVGSKLAAVVSAGRKCPVGYEPEVSGKCCVICPHGTTRNKYGKCVSTITQVKTCEEGEVYNECCPVVQATCAQPVITTCVDPGVCVPGCVCRPGLVRNACGECISVDNCI